MPRCKRPVAATFAVALSGGLAAVYGGYAVSAPATHVANPGTDLAVTASQPTYEQPTSEPPTYEPRSIGTIAPDPTVKITGAIEQIANFLEQTGEIMPAVSVELPDDAALSATLTPVEVAELLLATQEENPDLEFPAEVEAALDALLAAPEGSVLATPAREIAPVQVFYEPAPVVLTLDEAIAQWGASLVEYANGDIPLEAMCELEFAAGQFLRCDAAYMVTLLNEAFRETFGHDLPLGNTYRTLAQQIVLAQTKPGLAANPGTSQHGQGLAIDFGGTINDYTSEQHIWLRLNAPDFGWDNPTWARADGSRPEPWHWEFFANREAPLRALTAEEIAARALFEQEPQAETPDGWVDPTESLAGPQVEQPPAAPADNPIDITLLPQPAPEAVEPELQLPESEPVPESTPDPETPTPAPESPAEPSGSEPDSTTAQG